MGLGTHEINARLRARFGSDGSALLFEVGNGTGSRLARWADALAMTLWASRGLELIGFEVKASRSDWVKERDDPAKAEAVCQYCDRWYLVVGDASIVKEGELPEPWGLLVPHGDGLKEAKKPAKLKPKAVDRHFLAAIMRRAAEQSVDEKTIQAAVAAVRRQAYLEGQESARQQMRYDLERLKKLESAAEKLWRATGLQLGWLSECDMQRLRRKLDATVRPMAALETLDAAVRGVEAECNRLGSLKTRLDEWRAVLGWSEEALSSEARANAWRECLGVGDEEGEGQLAVGSGQSGDGEAVGSGQSVVGRGTSDESDGE